MRSRPALLVILLLPALVLAATGVGAGTPGAAAAPGRAAAPYGLMSGPDVSSHQHPNNAPIDWPRVRAGGRDFGIVKATEGTTYTNPFFAADWGGARAAGLYRAAYHYARPSQPLSSASDQANFFIQTVGDTTDGSTLPLVLDLEETGGLGVADLQAWTRSFLQTIEATTGRAPMIYTYPYFWLHSMGNTPAFTHYPLWIAAYAANPPDPLPGGWPNWTLWQFTASGGTDGVPPGNLDLSVFCCDPGALGALAASTGTAAPIASLPGITALNPSTVPSSTSQSVPLTVTGVGFRQGATVRVGAATVSPDSVAADGRSLRLTLPPNPAGSPLVQVLNPDGGQTTDAPADDGSNVLTVTNGQQYVPLSPLRLLDTRPGSGSTLGLPSPVQPGATLTVPVAGRAGVPAGATAVALNVAAVRPPGPGNLRLFPQGAPLPNAATVNYQPGRDVANAAVVALPANGAISLYSAGSRLDVVLDVVGYYLPPQDATPPAYAPQVPVRVLDTRRQSGQTQGLPSPVPAGAAVPVRLTGPGSGAPAGATAAVVHITGINPRSVGNLRLYPQPGGSAAATPVAPTATVNYAPGVDSANLAVVTVPPSGIVDVYSAGTPVDVAIDVVGWFTANVPGGGNSSYAALPSPARLADTRTGQGNVPGRIRAGTARALQVTGGVVPAGARGVVLNVAAVQPRGAGYLVAYPELGVTTPRPATSTVNYVPGQDTSNLVVVQLRNGRVDLASAGVDVDAVVDVVGYLTATG